MTSDFRDFLQGVVDKDYTELLEMTKLNLSEAFSVLRSHTDDDNKATVVLSVFLVTVLAADGEFSENERKMLCDIFGDASLIELAKGLDASTYATMNDIIDTLPIEEKVTLCHLAILIAAVDGTMDSNELAYIEELLD